MTTKAPWYKSENVFGRAFRWIFSLHEQAELPKDPAEIMLRQFHITAKSRFNASVRLLNVARFSFNTATALSLGLILVPVLQLSGLRLAYPTNALNGLQIFLAVSVLVYSIINSTARYETRAQALNECGDRIKELSRELRGMKSKAPGPDLDALNKRYTAISTDSENHSRADYVLAQLQAPENFRITGLERTWLYIKVGLSNLRPYIVPSTLMVLELLFILDILGITNLLSGRLQQLAEVPVAETPKIVQGTRK